MNWEWEARMNWCAGTDPSLQMNSRSAVRLSSPHAKMSHWLRKAFVESASLKTTIEALSLRKPSFFGFIPLQMHQFCVLHPDGVVSWGQWKDASAHRKYRPLGICSRGKREDLRMSYSNNCRAHTSSDVGRAGGLRIMRIAY